MPGLSLRIPGSIQFNFVWVSVCSAKKN